MYNIVNTYLHYRFPINIENIQTKMNIKVLKDSNYLYEAKESPTNSLAFEILDENGRIL